jgi:release factor glutamine methyltransferase
MPKDVQWLLEEKYGGKTSTEFEADVLRLLQGEPLAYVIGWQPFLGLTIHLDSRPLIPRPETEWWTEQMLSELAGKKTAVRLGLAAPSADDFFPASGTTILDLCAGSGAIGCAALSRLPQAKVYFGELDAAHKPTIEKNILENGLDSRRAEIRIGDLFEPLPERFDIIAVNPPYIPLDRTLPDSVTAYEPPHALYSGQYGLDLIQRIAVELPQHLTPNGEAWIECDSAHAKEACALFSRQDLRARLCTDQYGKDRYIVVSLP